MTIQNTEHPPPASSTAGHLDPTTSTTTDIDNALAEMSKLAEQLAAAITRVGEVVDGMHTAGRVRATVVVCPELGGPAPAVADTYLLVRGVCNHLVVSQSRVQWTVYQIGRARERLGLLADVTSVAAPQAWAIGMPAAGTVVPYPSEEEARSHLVESGGVLLRRDGAGEWVTA